MKKTTAAQVGQAVETMQAMIESPIFSATTRERQERLTNNLKAKLANA